MPFGLSRRAASRCDLSKGERASVAFRGSQLKGSFEWEPGYAPMLRIGALRTNGS